ncbi:hypothetical protein CHLRE_09g406600v5 [Chlamydomonas reinhardtii]|uniref:Uncharacterized protein n=1 Tax=Chlamydomonas reinhardtii TaxID=3055 RepID=A8J7S1_CHLRE|nr:uncharacterized protein CHLRE_09g406600v5 [Chlamydomonas reinhardtii]PNW79219.1 hypothetical protein CHLRE_09g406600v5 [Chlamydomonas reinhardtii]|eukprot:XP_001697678.1 predicted protein [Chlamydomonas reinhardtii]
MARSLVLPLVLVLAFLGLALAGRSLEPAARRNMLAGSLTPSGWAHALRVKGGKWCGLRDFPPLPDGYGASRLYCPFNAYDHNWMWRVYKATGTGSIASGDEVYLYINNPMLKYCRLASNIVQCGYGIANATKFVVEKDSGSGAIDFATDSVVLKVAGKYCKLAGSKHSQTLKCGTTLKSGATIFQLPAASFTNTQLINQLSLSACGADFFYDGSGEALVGCGTPRGFGFTINNTVALGTPGAPVVTAGTNITFKAYDNLYSYQVSVWKVDKNGNVWYDVNNTRGTSQWFVLERLTGAATGGEVTTNTKVALKSASNGKYCGIPSSNVDGDMKCDLAGPLSSLPAGYKYTYIVIA